MHELGIVMHIIKEVQDVETENHLHHIGSITLQIGEVSTVIPSYLQDCFRWAADKSEDTKGCTLKIETLPARTKCLKCGEIYETVKYGKQCPACLAYDTELVCGNECMIKEIEAE